MSTLSLIDSNISSIKIIVEFDNAAKPNAVIDFKRLQEETYHALWSNLVYREPITIFAYENQSGELEIDEAVINEEVSETSTALEDCKYIRSSGELGEPYLNNTLQLISRKYNFVFTGDDVWENVNEFYNRFLCAD